MVDDTIRSVAWAIAEAWWRKSHRRAAGSVPEANSSEEYADSFWQGFVDEAKAAIAAIEARTPPAPSGTVRLASDRFA